MKTRMTTTGLIVCIAIITLGIYDLVVVSKGDTNISISQYLMWVWYKAPFAVCVVFYIAGHLVSPLMLVHTDPIDEAKP